MANKFKVGDRVRATKESPKFLIGTVVFYDKRDNDYAVKFDGWTGGHSCSCCRSRGCPDTGNSGYFMREEQLELVADKTFKPGDRVKIIKRKPNNTTGLIDYDKKNGDVGRVGIVVNSTPVTDLWCTIDEVSGDSHCVKLEEPIRGETYLGFFNSDELELVETSTNRKPILRELPNTVVQVKSTQEYDELMDIYRRAGWKWCTGDEPSNWIDNNMLSERTDALHGKGLVLTAFKGGSGFFWRELGDWTTWTTAFFSGKTPEVISLDEFKIRQGLKSRYTTATEAAIMGAKPLTYQDLVDACKTVRESYEDHYRDAFIYGIGWDFGNSKQPSIKTTLDGLRKGIMQALREVPNRLKRALNKGMEAMYQLGWIDGDLDYTEEGTDELHRGGYG